jgi:hypothetical protein
MLVADDPTRVGGGGPTAEAYDAVIARARALLVRKNHDYGESWREMRPTSITDQILIKARRIRRLEELAAMGQGPMVSEGIEAEYLDILNYAALALILLGSHG